MGRLTDLADGVKAAPDTTGGRGSLWRQVFGSESKEEPNRRRPHLGGTHSRSLASTDTSFKRLLQAMRSMAPGGWSDDRWEQTRHFLGIAYVAIHRKCEQLGQAEFQVFHKDSRHPDGRRPVTEEEMAKEGNGPYDLVRLLEKPNKQDSFGDLMYRWGQQLDLTGTSLTWMVPNFFGCPHELYSVPTAVAIPQPAINPDYPDGFWRIQPVYPYGPFSSYPTPSSAVGAPIPSQWMLQFKYPHPLLRYEGFSPLTGLRLSLDVIESIYRSRWYTMKRSINPSAVLQMDEMEGAEPLPQTEIDRIRSDIEAIMQGTENHGQLLVTSPGARLDPWGAKPADMDYANGWDQETSFALAGFGITKPVAGMIEDSAYATLFAGLKQFHMLTLGPICSRFSSQLTRNLAPFFGDDLIVEIRCPRIDDHDVKRAKLDQLVTGKAITKNELRQENELPLTPEPWGNDIAGDPSPVESQQMQQEMLAAQQPGLPGQPAQEGVGMPPGQVPLEGELPPEEGVGMPPGAGPDEATIEATRPGPGNLSRGALGPRKSLNGRARGKSFYDHVREVIRNGRH